MFKRGNEIVTDAKKLEKIQSHAALGIRLEGALCHLHEAQSLSPNPEFLDSVIWKHRTIYRDHTADYFPAIAKEFLRITNGNHEE